MLCVQRCSFECLGCNKQLLSDCCLFWLIILVHALKPRESCAAKIPVDEMFLIDQPVWHQQPSSVQSYLTHLDARFQLQQVSSTMATCLNAKWLAGENVFPVTTPAGCIWHGTVWVTSQRALLLRFCYVFDFWALHSDFLSLPEYLMWVS